MPPERLLEAHVHPVNQSFSRAAASYNVTQLGAVDRSQTAYAWPE